MGVFLRWGVFGILAVAALVYAYNALGHLADRRKAAPAAVTAAPAAPAAPAVADATTPASVPAPAGDAAEEVPARCQVELDIARRAVESRSIGEPLDRLLRIQEIAWEQDAQRRARLTQVASRWFEAPTPVDAARLRRAVLDDCLKTGS